MTANTISFTEIVQLIHPDRNPNITDAGGKMKDAKLFRDNESILYKLAVKWGVIRPSTDVDVEVPRNVEESRSPVGFSNSRIERYKRHIAKLEKDRKAKEQSKADDEFRFRVRNRIFRAGDMVWIRTIKATVKITKVTNTRVYFSFNGKNTFAKKENARFTR